MSAPAGTATGYTGARHARTGGGGTRRRRRLVVLDLVGTVAWCVLGYAVLIDPFRRFEVDSAISAIRGMGLGDGISTALGYSFLVFVPGQGPLVAALTPSCSALTSMLALSALALFLMRRRIQALAGCLTGIGLIFVANQLRVVLSLLAGRWYGSTALLFFHDWLGGLITFGYTMMGLLVMMWLAMYRGDRAEQDRSGRHTASRPVAWGRPGLGYRPVAPDAAGTVPAPARRQDRVVRLLYKRVLPRRVSRGLAARRERYRIDYRVGHMPPSQRARRLAELASDGLGVHTATLVAAASYETDPVVLDALAGAIAARQWEPLDEPRVLGLRLWARAWLMCRPDPAGPGTHPDSGGKLIAVTGAGGPAGVAVIRALARGGYRVLALDADPDATGLRLAACHEVVPRADDPGYGPALLAVVQRHRPDALLCTVAEEYAALYPLVPELSGLGCATWLPGPAAVRTCLDKREFARAMRRAGVPHPATTGSARRAAAIPGPWIVKPAHGRGSRDVLAADTAEELARALATVPEPVVQTRLSGREFTADVLVGRDGTVLACVPRWREQTRAGISTRGLTFTSAPVAALVAATVRAVGLTGVANVQGFLDGDPAAPRTLAVMEVNPRFSGGLPLTLGAGADLVRAYLGAVLDPAAPVAPLTFQPGVRMARHFTEVFYTPSDVDGTATRAVPA